MRQADSTTIVIFGASGDLTARKLIPALFNLYRKGRLPGTIQVVGVSRTPYSHDAFRAELGENVEQFLGTEFDSHAWRDFADHLWYQPGDSKVDD